MRPTRLHRPALSAALRGARLRVVAQHLWEENKEQEQMKKEKEKVRPTRLQRPTLSAAAVPG